LANSLGAKLVLRHSLNLGSSRHALNTLKVWHFEAASISPAFLLWIPYSLKEAVERYQLDAPFLQQRHESFRAGVSFSLRLLWPQLALAGF
jgi:hypothetical protein